MTPSFSSLALVETWKLFASRLVYSLCVRALVFIQSIHFVVVFSAQCLTELQSGRVDYCYLAFGELPRFVYCLLQMIKVSSSLPVIEMWETYMLPNHSAFAPIDEEHFLEETRLSAALEKVNSLHLRAQFRKKLSAFFEPVAEHHLVNCCSTFSHWARPQLLLICDHCRM